MGASGKVSPSDVDGRIAFVVFVLSSFSFLLLFEEAGHGGCQAPLKSTQDQLVQ